MKNKIVYFLFILPISRLPYPLLYLLSDFFFIILYYLVGYRRKVVATNISNSYPEKSDVERKKIMRLYYHHFCDLILESLKGFTISEKELRKRFKLRNPEVMDRLHEEGKDVVITGGHFNNWEILALGINAEMKHRPMGIYKPLNNKYFDEKMKVSREKFGLIMVPMKETKQTFEANFKELNAVIFGIDQSPGNASKCYWMDFLNQDTPVAYGAEKYAKDYNRPVVYCVIHKTKRGHYEGELRLVTENPAAEPYGAILEKSTHMLEEDINDKPEFWLWTHKRWKMKRP